MNELTVQRPCLSTWFGRYLSQSIGPTALAIWLDRQHQRARLLRLDQHLLDDIAVNRVEAIREARRWD